MWDLQQISYWIGRCCLDLRCLVSPKSQISSTKRLYLHLENTSSASSAFPFSRTFHWNTNVVTFDCLCAQILFGLIFKRWSCQKRIVMLLQPTQTSDQWSLLQFDLLSHQLGQIVRNQQASMSDIPEKNFPITAEAVGSGKVFTCSRKTFPLVTDKMLLSKIEYEHQSWHLRKSFYPARETHIQRVVSWHDLTTTRFMMGLRKFNLKS